MCSKRKTAEEPASRQPPPFVLALDDYDPYKSENIYDAKPSFTAPSIDTQIAVTRGEKLAVLSNEIDWWILCKSIDFDKQGYVPTILFAPVCVAGAEDSPCERNVDGDNEDKRIMVPCMEQQYVDLKYFPNAPDPDGNLQRKEPCPLERANFFSRITFWWMTGLIVKGYRRPLTSDDIWALSKENQAKELVSKFQAKWDDQMSKLPRNTTSYESLDVSRDSGIENRALETQTGLTENGLKSDVESTKRDTKSNTKEKNAEANEDQSFVEVKDPGKGKEQKEGKEEKTKSPSMWLTLAHCFGWTFLFGAFMKLFHDALLFVSPYLLSHIIRYIEGKGPQDTWRGYVLAFGLFVVATFQSMFLHQYFDKAVITGLRARSAATGIVYRKMLRLSNKGRQEFTSGGLLNLMSVDAKKFQDITTYLNMVWSAPLQIIVTLIFLYELMGWSIFAGVGTMVLLLPFNYFVTKKIKNVQTCLMKQKDQRSKVINDVLSGIKILKLYAWEESFQKQITTLRSKELKLLRSFRLWKNLTSFAFTCSPFIVSLATFTLYVLIGNELNAEKAFVAISLFNILRFPMTILPDIIAAIVQCHVSIKRLTKYLQADELDQNNVSYTHDKDDPVAVKIENGSFTWEDKNVFMLKNINLEVEKGGLIAIVGQVGCGKSSLLSTLLGEMEKLHGSVSVNGSIAYVPQQAWIQNATLESNVLFGKSYNPKKYDRVIDACALRSDLEVLPGGDLTEIGEKGINLSGGQKQRVSIARALYSGADLYFFDDPLSAVDSHVAKHIFDEVIGPNGLLKKKVRILVTHSVNFLPQVDKIVVMKNGMISEIGTYDELISSSGAYAEFLRTFATEDEEDLNDTEDEAENSAKKRDRVTSMTSVTSNKSCQLERMLHLKEHLEKRQREKDKGAKMIQDETSETGRVKSTVFLTYAKSVGIPLTIFFLLFGLGSKFFLVGARIWLARWSSDTSISTSERDKYLLVYGLLGIGHCICTYLSAIMMTFGACIASKWLHNNLLVNILHCPMSFFETTPMGRLTNRFSKDINVIDTDIPQTTDSFSGCLFGIISVIFTISYSTPWFLVALVPLAIAYITTQRFYVASSRQLKRIESVRRSPIYNHFFESINGVSTIRATRQQQRFVDENEKRIDENQAAFAPSMYSNRWLAVRLEFVGNCLIFCSAFFAILSKDTISAGLAGLSISYAMQLTQTLNWLVRMTSQLETDIVAVERVKEYTDVPTEAAWINPNKRPPKAWPDKGVVHVDNFYLRYRPELDYALNDIKFDAKAAEKIGIVGRTGAGKSTFAIALFRMIEAAGGQINIDGINISQLGLQDLRSRLTIIPQDPVLFTGSIRFNLDPFDEHSDEALWSALEISHLKTFVAGLPGELEESVAEGGGNFSVGQRQLMCLARAVLRKSKILVLDEATAAVDMETDEFIQRTIREEFNDCTVFTIAHRLNTVLDYDRILVLERGKIIEFDSPQKLLQSKGTFYGMAKDANLI